MSAQPFQIAVGEALIRISFPAGTEISPGLIAAAIVAEAAADRGANRNDLWDFRGCPVAGDFDFVQMRGLVGEVGRLRERHQNAKTAVLVDADVAYGLGRMFQSLADGVGYEVAVLREEEAALRWLGVADRAGQAHDCQLG